ncbi:transcription factor IIIB 50 kDa subunit [Denticeps clupeoides]|uniref:Transcription factor IIIB 50 kDa subunit n=1 Tax=Denticeps clupeoides TaxID=299321 RepID=A0AAY4API3_9TELE|nr:transcription factor IIIB 50 kDa subunit [Denticeps clupeoides]
MSRACPHCGSGNVVEDDLYSEKQLVCEDCGSLLPEVELTSTRTEELQATAVPYYESTQTEKRKCPNLIKGCGRLRALCRIFRFPSDMESSAVSLYEGAYGHPSFLHTSLSKKEALAGSCVLAVSRMNSWPLGMGSVVAMLEADPALFGAIYQELIKCMNLQTVGGGITELLEGFCHDFKLGRDQVGAEYGETTRELKRRALDLLELAADSWIVTGRQPQPMLLAAVYLAWQSLSPVKRMKVPLTKFCVISKFGSVKEGERRRTAQKRVVEMREVLCKLGQELPWLSGSPVKPSDVAVLVEDILALRLVLQSEAMRRHEQSLLSETSETRAAGDALSSAPEAALKSSSHSQVEEKAPPAGGHSNDSQLSELPWAKRHLFVPPCVRVAKKPRAEAAGPDVTGDEDISDGEIESYIRTDQEMRYIVRLQKTLQQQKEEEEEGHG